MHILHVFSLLAHELMSSDYCCCCYYYYNTSSVCTRDFVNIILYESRVIVTGRGLTRTTGAEISDSRGIFGSE